MSGKPIQVYKTKWFARFARQEGIADTNLAETIKRAEQGLIDADLGGGLIKMRIARPGQGRSGGHRAVIAYRLGNRAVFIYGLAKSDQDNFAEIDLKPRERSHRSGFQPGRNESLWGYKLGNSWRL